MKNIKMIALAAVAAATVALVGCGKEEAKPVEAPKAPEGKVEIKVDAKAATADAAKVATDVKADAAKVATDVKADAAKTAADVKAAAPAPAK